MREARRCSSYKFETAVEGPPFFFFAGRVAVPATARWSGHQPVEFFENFERVVVAAPEYSRAPEKCVV